MGNFEFKKKFGQNFLTDKNLLDSIVKAAGVTGEDVVVEIGAGKGALTEALSKTAKKVYSFEIDGELFEFLSEKFSNSNVEFVFEDVMEYDDKKLNNLVGQKFKLVANLPYYVTSPILTRFLKNENLISATVMVQEEVADRIIAKPKSKDYGVLTILCQIFGNAKKVLRVNRKMFYPVPKVDSAVVHIERNENLTDFDLCAFEKFIKRAFSMRRKKLSSNLETEKLKKENIEKALEELGFSVTSRAEEFSIEQLLLLFKKFGEN